MPSILVVTGSIRPNSVNEKVVPLVAERLKAKDADVVIADLKELDMPFFDSPVPASNPDFAPTHEGVKHWTQLVDQADGVVLVTPEYNHTMSPVQLNAIDWFVLPFIANPVQLNAIDWIGNEWKDKPVALVGYGWTSGAHQAHATAREALAVNLKAKVADSQANLFLGKELGPDGSVADANAVNSKIDSAIDELLSTAG